MDNEYDTSFNLFDRFLLSEVKQETPETVKIDQPLPSTSTVNNFVNKISIKEEEFDDTDCNILVSVSDCTQNSRGTRVEQEINSIPSGSSLPDKVDLENYDLNLRTISLMDAVHAAKVARLTETQKRNYQPKPKIVRMPINNTTHCLTNQSSSTFSSTSMQTTYQKPTLPRHRLKSVKVVMESWAAKLQLQASCGLPVDDNMRVDDVVDKAIERIQELRTISKNLSTTYTHLMMKQREMFVKMIRNI